ncbi:MAG: YfiR family protein, partial [Candidatus Acidiferrum sp.]
LSEKEETLHRADQMRRAPPSPEGRKCPGRICRWRSRLLFAALVGVLTIGSARWAWAQANASSEYQVKAAFLFHFAQFVEWPQVAFKDAAAPLTYCTVGEDFFHGALDASLTGKTIDGRPIRVRHFKQAREIQGCQVLFIGAQQKQFVFATLANLNGSPVLTVGESEQFVQEGGMIGFLLEDNKVRFEINLSAAEHAKLKISARLLELAKTVIGGPKGT